MSTREQLRQFANQLTDEELDEFLSIVAQRLNARIDSVAGPSNAPPDAREDVLMSGFDFNRMPQVDIATLAEQQGVKPITEVDKLLGDFWPEDEDEDFDAVLREWRDES